MPVTRLISLLKECKLYLVNPGKWDDPYENVFLKYALRKINLVENGSLRNSELDTLAHKGFFLLFIIRYSN